MNYQKSKLALALASATLLVACGGGSGGGGGGGAAPTTSLSGVAANGLLANAKVCVDSNDNLQCDASEPSTTTNVTGEYSLAGLKNTDIEGKNLIVEVGSATAGNSTGKSNIFLRKLKTPIAANEVLTAQSINPFTTLLGGSDITLAQLATAFGVTEAQLGQADYSGDAAVSSIANMLAAKIAGELETTVTSSAVNKGGVLLGVNGLLQDVATMLKTKTNLTSAELEAALAEITVDRPALDKVVDASLALTVNNRNDIALSQVAVLVTAYQADTNTPIQSTADNQLVIGETDTNGGALISLPEYAQATIDIDVELKKEGFVTVVKRIKGVQAGDRIPLTLAMTEEALSSKKTDTSFDLPSATAASFDTGEPAFTLALVSLPSGEKVLLAGESAAQAMADGESDVQVGVQIPVNRIDTDNVTAITAGVQGFDPSKPGDAQSFPGNFEGVGHDQGYPEDGVNSEFLGGASASADGEEPEVVPIISTSFAQIRLEDQDGNEFEMVSAEAGAAADSTPVIYLRVPESTYATVTKDMNDDVAGVQVPVYVYRSGQGWVLIGLATLVKWDNGSYVAYADGLPLQTGSGQLYAKVEITQGNEWIRWVNLDWPVVAGNDIVSCKFSGNVRWQGEKSERYNGSGYIEFSDGARQYLYPYGGSFDYNGLTTQARAADAKLFLYNQYTYQYEEFTFTDKTPADGSDCDFVLNPTPALLTNPFQCEVQGRMVKKGLPVSWQWVYLSGERFYRYVYTNAAGEYSSIAPCDADVKLVGGWYDYNQGKYGIERTFRVNSQVASDESQDDNALVRMNDIEMPNQPPSVWAWTNTWRVSIPNGQSANVDLMAYGYDYDSDSLTYEWTCPGSAVAAWVYSNSAKSCSIHSSAVTVDSGQHVPWSVKVTDTEGASSTYNGSVYAEVKGRNKAPRITGILRDNRNLNCTRTTTQELECVDNIAETSTPEYKVVAVDADGDTLTYSATAPLTGVAGSENDGRFQINGVSLGSNMSTVTVTDVRSGDDARSSQATLTVTGIENKPPVVYVGLNRNRYTKGVHTTAVVSASLWDDNANYEALRDSAELEVKDKDGNAVSPAPSVVREGNRWNVDIANLAIGQYQLVIQVSDGAKSTQASTAFNVVNSMAPQLTLTAPGNLAINQLNRLVNPAAQFVARVWDDGGMDGLDISVELVKGDASWALDYEVDGYVITGNFQNIAEETLEAGTYTLRVKVKDADNDEIKRESSISIELPNNSAEIIIQ